MDVECGGKRSATPLWLRVALLLHQRVTAVRESGVALRLPPHSTSVVLGHPGDFFNRPGWPCSGSSARSRPFEQSIMAGCAIGKLLILLSLASGPSMVLRWSSGVPPNQR